MQGTWRAGLHAPPIVFINRLGSHADDVYAARTDAERAMQSAQHPHAKLAEVRAHREQRRMCLVMYFSFQPPPLPNRIRTRCSVSSRQTVVRSPLTLARRLVPIVHGAQRTSRTTATGILEQLKPAKAKPTAAAVAAAAKNKATIGAKSSAAAPKAPAKAADAAKVAL